jgi:hypothetical protein
VFVVTTAALLACLLGVALAVPRRPTA